MSGIRLYFLFVIMFIGGSPAFAQRQQALLSYTDQSGNEKAVHTIAEWDTKRSDILKRMQEVMGVLPDRANLPPMNIQYTDSIDEHRYTRYTIRFTVAQNEQVTAYLYVPNPGTGLRKFPAMLALHETDRIGKGSVDGQGHNMNLGYAKELAQRGYVVIAPDYPDFGDSEAYDFKTDRYGSGTMKAIFNNMRCVDLLQSRPDVYPDKIGVIGHSLGGHNAIFTGAFDDRLKVVVSSCGWTLFHDYYNGDEQSAKKHGGKLWAWAQERYMPLIRDKYHLNPDELPFDFDEIIAAIAPRAFFSNSPLNDANFSLEGVKKGIDSISKVYGVLQVPARLKVHYPDSRHDFPPTARWQAYRFIDNVLDFNPVAQTSYAYLYNAQYFKRMEDFAADKSQKNIVILGNSLTERGQWEEILGRADVANRGIGSDITGGYISRLKDVFALKPKICFIEGGVNDLGHNISPDIILRNLAVLIDTLRREGIVPVLNTLTYVTDHYKSHDPKDFNNRIKSLNRGIRSLAKKKKVRLIDLNKKISDNSFLIKKYAIEDGIHYTGETYSLWGKEIMKML